jgi:hypothetical protein
MDARIQLARHHAQTEMMMNRFIAAIAFGALLASPSMAQSYDPDVGSGNVAPPPGGYYGPSNDRSDARAQGRHHHRSHRQPEEVRDSQGLVVGEDPDPNIRSRILRNNRDEEF